MFSASGQGAPIENVGKTVASRYVVAAECLPQGVYGLPKKISEGPA